MKTDRKIKLSFSNYAGRKAASTDILIRWLNEVKAEGYEWLSTDYDSYDAILEITAMRHETEQEKADRERARNISIENYERLSRELRKKQYEELKKEFECQ